MIVLDLIDQESSVSLFARKKRDRQIVFIERLCYSSIGRSSMYVHIYVFISFSFPSLFFSSSFDNECPKNIEYRWNSSFVLLSWVAFFVQLFTYSFDGHAYMYIHTLRKKGVCPTVIITIQPVMYDFIFQTTYIYIRVPL